MAGKLESSPAILKSTSSRSVAADAEALVGLRWRHFKDCGRALSHDSLFWLPGTAQSGGAFQGVTEANLRFDCQLQLVADFLDRAKDDVLRFDEVLVVVQAGDASARLVIH